jgi:hypothetical protein
MLKNSDDKSSASIFFCEALISDSMLLVVSYLTFSKGI